MDTEVRCGPLHDLDSLWEWKAPTSLSQEERLKQLTRTTVLLPGPVLPPRPRLLFCHDYAGELLTLTFAIPRDGFAPNSNKMVTLCLALAKKAGCSQDCNRQN